MVFSLGNEKGEAWAWSLVKMWEFICPVTPGLGGWGAPCLAFRAAQIPGHALWCH